MYKKQAALRAFGRLFSGLVFFLNREVSREIFEFIICSFRGRVGWDGPGSPYKLNDVRITHHIVDKPLGEVRLAFLFLNVCLWWPLFSLAAHFLTPLYAVAAHASFFFRRATATRGGSTSSPSGLQIASTRACSCPPPSTAPVRSCP